MRSLSSMQLRACRKAFLWARSVRMRTNSPDRLTLVNSTVLATNCKNTHTHYTLLLLWYIVEDKIFKKPLGNIYTTLVRSNIYTCVVMINEKCIFMYIFIYWMYGK